jgi:hypothetical protein
MSLRRELPGRKIVRYVLKVTGVISMEVVT